jgi:CheY-like chemotaxis protein
MARSNEVRILIVDDDDVSKFLTTRIIQNHSPRIQLESVRSAMAALERISDPGKAIPDIVIVDINMPEMTGFEFIHEFGKFGFAKDGPPHIVITSSTLDLDDLRKAHALSVPFFSKPLLESDIKSIVSLLA